jgi:heme a synthase
MNSQTLAPTGPTPAPADAREQRRRRLIGAWFWSGAALTFAILVIGGITRLTQSGLSIVDWQPIMGVVPPLSEAQWLEAFDRYRAFPEYQLLRRGMTLEEFKFIFFWEYLHRLAARLIGMVFLVPFLIFLARGWLSRPLVKRSLLLFALGAMQGVIGWVMVASGLVDRPHVSHYKLAAHLSIAFAIFGFCVWFALDQRGRAAAAIGEGTRRMLRRGLLVVGGLLGVQILYGAFVAGLKAGFVFNTFPLMAGGLLPPQGLELNPVLRNLVENPMTVQWLHRVIGTVLGVVAIAFFVRAGRQELDPRTRVLNVALLVGILGQYLLGVMTLVMRVPVSLGVAHQAAAMVLFGIWLLYLHQVRRVAAA